jgi:hypothetical protein
MKFIEPDKGLVYPSAENNILFVAEYIALRKNAKELCLIDLELTHRAIDLITDVDDNLLPTDGDGTFSHDNMTGLVCLSNILDYSFHKKYFNYGWKRRWHPRDVIFYLYAKGGIIGFLASFLLWIPMIAMAVSCAQDYKVRQGRKILKTDGKLLAWLRVNSFNLPITKWLCTKIIERNKEFGSWKHCFEIYFGKKHPISQFDEEVYNANR